MFNPKCKKLERKLGNKITIPYRHPGRSDARPRTATHTDAARRTEYRHPPARYGRTRHPATALRRGPGRPLQRTDDRPHDAGILRPRPRVHTTAPHRHGTLRPVGPRLQPYPQGGTYHRRPRRGGEYPHPAYRRSRRLPQPRPRHLGRVE